MPREPEISYLTYSNLSVGVFKVGRTALANFVYVVIDDTTRDAIVIDPGWEHRLLLDRLTEWEANLVAVLLTHSDEDHTNGAEIIMDSLRVPAYISSLEVCPRNLARLFPLPLVDRNELRLGALPVLCIHTPGHSTGSFCFKVGNLLFTGDTLFNEGCGYCGPPSGSVKDMFQSLRTLKEMMNGEVVIFPAHQYKAPPGLTMRQVRRINPYLRISDLETFTAFSQRRVVDIPAMDE
jgi:hydroxyacylglutathione hydrolase